jgi:hypothetical protein
MEEYVMFEKMSIAQAHKLIKYLGIGLYIILMSIILIIPFGEKPKATIAPAANYNLREYTELQITDTKQVLLETVENYEKEIEIEVEPIEEITYTKYIVNADYLNNRATPELTDNVVNILPYGTVVEVEYIDGDWAKLKEGTYISSKYVEGLDELTITDQFNIYTDTGITEDDVEDIVANNPNMEPISDNIISIQHDYGVNGCLLMAIATYESGRGTSKLALEKNNYFGLRDNDWLSFDNPLDSVEVAAKSIASYNVTTIEDVGYIYCPDGNTRHWIDSVVSIMNEFINY